MIGDGHESLDGSNGNDGITVTWNEGCWYNTGGSAYQAMEFTLQSANPVALEGTLYFTTNCDPSQGTDNLNDTGGTTPSGSWTFWFIHHPNNYTTSAVWSLGEHYTGCIDYSTAPNC
jgi:hypothetical protein